MDFKTRKEILEKITLKPAEEKIPGYSTGMFSQIESSSTEYPIVFNFICVNYVTYS